MSLVLRMEGRLFCFVLFFLLVRSGMEQASGFDSPVNESIGV